MGGFELKWLSSILKMNKKLTCQCCPAALVLLEPAIFCISKNDGVFNFLFNFLISYKRFNLKRLNLLQAIFSSNRVTS